MRMNGIVRYSQFHTRKAGILILSLMIFFILSSGCAEKNDTVDPATEDVDQLRVGLILWDTPVKVSQQFLSVEEYLGSELDMDIKTIKSRDYYNIIEAMEKGKLDIAFFGPFSYVIAAEKAGAEAIVAGGVSGELDTYNSYIIVNNDTGLNSISELEVNSQNLTFAFVDPASTSGNLIPRGYLLSKGIDPETDFKATIFSGGHDISLRSVMDGEFVDAGGISSGAYERYFSASNDSKQDVVILWRSDPIPPSPIAVRKDMDPILKESITEAFLDMPRKSPGTFNGFMEVRGGHDSYVEVHDNDYAFIRKMALALEYI